MPKVYIKTFGCQMNTRDSEIICGLLKDAGFELTADEREVDIVIINTCSVRKHAEDRVWSELGALGKRWKKDDGRGTKKIIGLVGCMVQNYKENIFKHAPNVDFIVGPSDIGEIPLIIKKIIGTHQLSRKKIQETQGIYRTEEIYKTNYLSDKTHSYVVISEGCSNFCSYCVVPFVRGHLRCRDWRDIIEEVKRRVGQGITEITLLGQNVNAYRYDDVDFVRLLQFINEIQELKSFSFITSHPKDTKTDLFYAMADLERLKKYLHLPIQSGSDKILKLMSRQYTKAYYLNLVENYKKIVNGGQLAADFIVGFPSETEDDFNDSLDLLKEVQFDFSYIFKYSPRPHTKAEQMPDDVSKELKERRHKVLLEMQRGISVFKSKQ